MNLDTYDDSTVGAIGCHCRVKFLEIIDLTTYFFPYLRESIATAEIIIIPFIMY